MMLAIENSVNDCLSVLEPHIAETLIPAKRFGDIRRCVGELPTALMTEFGFECRLSPGDHPSDFQFSVSAGSDGHAMLADGHPDISGSETGRCCSGWEQVRRFASAWSHMDPEQVPCIILGMDCDAPDGRNRGLLFHLRTEKRTADEIQELLPIATGHLLPKRMRQNLQRCLSHALPTFVGFMFGRSTDALRLTQRLTISETLPYLDSISWTGNRRQVARLLEIISGWTTHIALSLNVGAVVEPYLGLELLNWTKPAAPHSVWQNCLQTLTGRGLCTPEKHDALLHWRGISRLEHSPSSAAFADGDQRDPDMLHLHVRNLSHLKLICRPHSGLEAKVYLNVRRAVRRWSSLR
ncbi:MAG: hypothetical protein KDA89_21455 [Planctomycetaceae bacterium]|nr:hypothetical protein [Planctomycetaceae bacterium]